ncbi:MAG: hypothetical protein H7338_22550 [Candidatus Sericytochromatia bacterium]|nr:hypothetical protein [Candidatus Sericytochromatia bacterium]
MPNDRLLRRPVRIAALSAMATGFGSRPALATLASDLVEPAALGRRYHAVTRPGETAQGDGRPLHMDGRRDAKGLGMHANGVVESLRAQACLSAMPR